MNIDISSGLPATDTVSVTLVLPAALHEAAGGHQELNANGECVREVLQAIGQQYPSLTRCLMTRDGELRPYVNLFLREQDLRALDGLDTPVRDGDRVLVVASVAGG